MSSYFDSMAREVRDVFTRWVWEWAIQVTETFPTEEDARAALLSLGEQCGYLGGRYLPPDPVTPAWRVQAFLSDDGPQAPEGAWLPDGCRRVIVPPALAAICGFPPREG